MFLILALLEMFLAGLGLMLSTSAGNESLIFVSKAFLLFGWLALMFKAALGDPGSVCCARKISVE